MSDFRDGLKNILCEIVRQSIDATGVVRSLTVSSEDGCLYEITHVRKDGSTLTKEVSFPREFDA